jgi:hypothetical protein
MFFFSTLPISSPSIINNIAIARKDMITELGDGGSKLLPSGLPAYAIELIVDY